MLWLFKEVKENKKKKKKKKKRKKKNETKQQKPDVATNNNSTYSLTHSALLLLLVNYKNVFKLYQRSSVNGTLPVNQPAKQKTVNQLASQPVSQLIHRDFVCCCQMLLPSAE